jgi:hypothetical protein
MHLLCKRLLFTLRSFSRSPIFAATFILSIAIGIGSAVSVFAVMSALLLRSLPVPHPEVPGCRSPTHAEDAVSQPAGIGGKKHVSRRLHR